MKNKIFFITLRYSSKKRLKHQWESVLCILEKESKTKTTFSLIGCTMNYKYCILTASSRALQPKGTSDHVTCLKPRKNDMLCYLCQNRAAWRRLIKCLYYHSSLTFEYYKWQELSHTLQSSPYTNSVQQFGIATKRRNLARTHEN